MMEHLVGIEPTSPGWKPGVLPLDDRCVRHCVQVTSQWLETSLLRSLRGTGYPLVAREPQGEAQTVLYSPSTRPGKPAVRSVALHPPTQWK